jgi:hypothetical protein
MKTCTKCNIEKPYSDFYKTKRSNDGHHARCKQCQKQYKAENKHKWIEYRQKNKQRDIEYRKNRSHIKKDYDRKYREKNRERLNRIKREYRKNKRNQDPVFRLKGRIRARLLYAIKSKNYDKKYSTIEYLGCSYKFYKDYLQNRFKDGMSWDNHGEWHIDHIIPLSSANTEEELIKLFHYTNTQPLWASENQSKGSKIL